MLCAFFFFRHLRLDIDYTKKRLADGTSRLLLYIMLFKIKQVCLQLMLNEKLFWKHCFCGKHLLYKLCR